MRVSAWHATVLLMASAAPAAPQGSNLQSGNSHYQGCKGFVAYESGGDSFMRGTCAGIVITLMSVGPVLPPGPRFCSPQGATFRQGARVVVSYMDRNPGELHKPFVLIANTALREAWPCEGN